MIVGFALIVGDAVGMSVGRRVQVPHSFTCCDWIETRNVHVNSQQNWDIFIASKNPKFNSITHQYRSCMGMS